MRLYADTPAGGTTATRPAGDLRAREEEPGVSLADRADQADQPDLPPPRGPGGRPGKVTASRWFGTRGPDAVAGAGLVIAADR